MASSIRVRATANGEITEVQTLIQHPMEIRLRQGRQG